MLNKGPLRLALAIVAVAAAFAVVQMVRHRRDANGAVPADGGGRSGVAQQPACSQAPKHTQSTGAADSAAFTLRMDYAGAEELMNALERDSLSHADVDSLLRVPGLCAMVDNVTRFLPEAGVAEFRSEIRAFAPKKKAGKHDRYFRFKDVWQSRSKMRSLIAALRADERRIIDETLSQLQPYAPRSGNGASALSDTSSSTITAYFVAGGVSDGFIFEKDPQSFYANLVGAYGDVNGVVMNMAHEAYHGMQFAAQKRAGIQAGGVSDDGTRPSERLFAVTLSEGTANYVVDPTRSSTTGPSVEDSRKRYRRHAEPKRIAENFARFDNVLKGLRDGRLTWDAAYREGFTNVNDASFYFVGYEMTKAIERYCGRECIGRLFQEHPIEFFRRYIALYREHPEIAGRFSAETEATITSYEATPSR